MCSDFPGGSVVMNLPASRERCRKCGFNPWVGISSISKNTGKFHGQRSLSCYSPWGQKELDSTDSAWLYMYSYTYI